MKLDTYLFFNENMNSFIWKYPDTVLNTSMPRLSDTTNQNKALFKSKTNIGSMKVAQENIRLFSLDSISIGISQFIDNLDIDLNDFHLYNNCNHTLFIALF